MAMGMGSMEKGLRRDDAAPLFLLDGKIVVRLRPWALCLSTP